METEAPPVVLDVGSGLTKLGLANQASPQHVFSTVVARPKVGLPWCRHAHAHSCSQNI